MPMRFNRTSTVLIPKVKNSVKITDLRPISLCNVMYKVKSKVIINRLKLILLDTIYELQITFVPNHHITIMPWWFLRWVIM